MKAKNREMSREKGAMRMQFQNSRFAARYSLLSMFDYLPNTTHKGFVFHAPYYRKDLIKRVLRKNGRVFRFRKREQALKKQKRFTNKSWNA